MAEVLGAVSSVLAIATIALQLSKSSYEIIASFRSQHSDIANIRSDLDTLSVVLELILEQAGGSPDDDRLEVLRRPLSCCEIILQDMHDSLAECTKHAKDHRESVRTWLKLRYREKSFTDTKQRLSSYKTTLCVAFHTMNMRDHATTQTSLDELTTLTERAREELEVQLDLLEDRISTAAEWLQATLDADRAQLQACLKSLEEAQTVRESRAQVIVSDNTASGQNTRMIAGTDTAQPTFHLSVNHNRAADGASMAAGIHSADVLKTLLQQSAAPASTVSIVEMMQTGRFDVSSPAVHDLLPQQTPEHRSGTMPRRIEQAHDSSDRGISMQSEQTEARAVRDP